MPTPPARRKVHFEAALDRTDTGSPALLVSTTDGDDRALATHIYLLSAELEQSSAQLKATWQIRPEPKNKRIVVEASGHEEELAAQLMVADVMDKYMA